MKTAVCLSLALVATAFVASDGCSFCDTADDKVLCSQLVGKAKTWEKAMTNALKNAKKKAEGGKSVADVVAAKLPENLRAVTKDSIVSTCHEAYDNIIDNLNDCIGFVKNDPTAALRVYLSAITYSDCTDGLDEFKLHVAEATQFYQEIYKLDDVLLAVSEKKP